MDQKIIKVPRGLLGVGGSGMGMAAMKGRGIINTMIYFVKAILQLGNDSYQNKTKYMR